MKKIYYSDRQIHMGGLKRTIKKGCEVLFVQNKEEKYIEIAGEKITDLSDFNICLKNGFFKEKTKDSVIEYDKQDEILQKKKQEEKREKMKVFLSDEDSMEMLEVPKKEKVETKKEDDDENTKKIRGMKLVEDKTKNIEKVEEIDGVKIKVSTNGQISDNEMLQDINGQSKVVASITANKDKKEAEIKAKQRANKRKKESEENQKKMKEEQK